MPDYRAMYFSLFNFITDAIEILQNAQIKGEEDYINSEEDYINSEDDDSPKSVLFPLENKKLDE